jgi:hypothetical protein
LFATAALVALIAPRARASDAESDMVGKPAPEIQVTAWIHGDGRTKLADFRGEAVLLEFWRSRCPMSRCPTPHMNKLHEQYGAKGLNVIGVTSEDLPTTLRWITHAADSVPGYRIAIRGGEQYAVTSMPYAYLIGPDGVVAWEGHPGSLPVREVLARVLKSVKPPSKEALEARAASRLAFAESLVEDRQFARAEAELTQIQKAYPTTETAKKAATRAKEIVAGPNEAEYDAQKQIARLVGGFEHPAERLKAKEAEALAKRLAKLSDELKPKAPRASLLSSDLD